jgi:hypothetical protein
MTLRNRLRALEASFGRADAPCPDHRVTSIVGDGDALPDDSAIPPCPNCGRPGAVQIIVEEIVERVDAGE